MDTFMLVIIILIFITLLLAIFRVNCNETMVNYLDLFYNPQSTPGTGAAYPVEIYRLPYNYPAGVWSDHLEQHFDRPANWYL